MTAATNGIQLQQAVLDAIRDTSSNGSVSFDPTEVFDDTMKKLGNPSDQQLQVAVLCYFNDLLRTGTICLGDTEKMQCRVGTGAREAWPNGRCHVTSAGAAALKQASRDPINPPGYLAYLDQETQLDPVTRGYVEEALKTYAACCYKAAAVVIGAAVENLVFTLRDELLKHLSSRGAKPIKDLKDWRAKTVLDAIADKILPDLKANAKNGDDTIRQLSEDAQARLQPIAAEFRKIRNDAGHPASLTPVNPADVHANLLLFPSTAKLLCKLAAWVAAYYG
jgi:hypothetical protein